MVAKTKTKALLVLALLAGLIVSPAPARRGHSRLGSGRSIGSRSFARRSHPSSSIGRHHGSRRSAHSSSHRSSGISHHSRPSYGHSRAHNGSRHYRSGRLGPATHRYLGRHNGSLRGRISHYKGSSHGHARHSRHYGRRNYRYRYGYARPHYRSYYIYPYSHYYTRPHYRSYYYGYPYYYSLPRYRYYYFGYPGYYVSPYSQYYYDYRYESPPDVPDEPKYDPNDPYRDVREKIERQETRELAEQAKAAAQQAKQTAEQAKRDVQYIKANQYLDNVADAFAQGNYAKAADHAARGLPAEPENAVLPFVYSQSLFANAQYRTAADVLREALRMTHIIDEHGVYYSAGFYPDEDTLPQQIDRLSEAAQAEPNRADLKLLLGYQLMGMGALDEALGPLQKIQYDYVNGQAAKMLIEVLEKSRRPELDEAPEPDNY